MSIWIELRCEESAEPHANPVNIGDYGKDGGPEIKSHIFGSTSFEITSNSYSRYKSLLEGFSCVYIATNTSMNSAINCKNPNNEIGPIAWSVTDIIPKEFLIETMISNAYKSLP